MGNSLTSNQPPAGNSFVLQSPFKVRLTMLSDWHVGTGAGRPGSVDSLIARDADGFPFVPAKTLNGIWRDAMERLTLGLDDGRESNWSKWVEKIFGIQPNQIDAPDLARRLQNGEDTYSSSALSLQPARLSDNLRTRIGEAFNRFSDREDRKRERQKLLDALTFIKPGVAIDEDSGTAVPEFLRFEEMGRGGSVLEAQCELAENNETISALLLLSAKLVERLGGKRRRGAGLCALSIVGCDDSQIDKAISHLRQTQYTKNNHERPVTNENENDRNHASEMRSIIRENKTTGQESASEVQGDKKDRWQVLEFSLKLHTPISVVTATLGNVSKSLDYIPGTYLLPHVTRVLRKRLGDRAFQALAYGDLQVLPATVEINEKRGLPVPKAIYYDKIGGGFDKQKDAKSTVYNVLTEKALIEAGAQKKSYRTGYVEALAAVGPATNNLPSYKSPPKTLLMHNTVEDKVQRPTENVGGVYSREAIASGTTMRGEIRLKQRLADELGTDWWQTLNGNVRLGTSRKDDYGSAELSLSAPKAFESSSKINGNRLTVYLLSDCLLRNSTLRHTNLVNELAAELNDKLGVTLKPIKSSDKETTSLMITRRFESWHEGWGFPRPTLTAMEAGSCVVFEVNGDLTVDALHEIEAAGIGERRGEGYGQVRFNPPLLTGKINTLETAKTPNETSSLTNGKTSEINNEESAFAKLIEETAWRAELKVAALKVADSSEDRKRIFGFDIDERKPPMSQIGGLRSVVDKLKSKENAAIVTDWLDHLMETKNRREKWAKSDEEAKRKIKRVRELIEQERKVWSMLAEPKAGETKVWQTPLTIERSKEDLEKTLWAEAVRTLFDACARAHKRELEKRGANSDGPKD